MGLGKTKDARNDFQLVLKMDPENNDAKAEMKKLNGCNEVRPSVK